MLAKLRFPRASHRWRYAAIAAVSFSLGSATVVGAAPVFHDVSIVFATATGTNTAAVDTLGQLSVSDFAGARNSFQAGIHCEYSGPGPTTVLPFLPGQAGKTYVLDYVSGRGDAPTGTVPSVDLITSGLVIGNAFPHDLMVVRQGPANPTLDQFEIGQYTHIYASAVNVECFNPTGGGSQMTFDISVSGHTEDVPL